MNMSARYPSGYWKGEKRVRTLGPHRNPGLELVLVLNGSVSWDYEGRRVDVPPGHLSFTWPWQWHGGYNNIVPSVELCWVTIPFARLPARATTRVRLHASLGLRPAENRRVIHCLAGAGAPVIKASRLLRQLFPVAANRLRAEDGVLSFETRALLLLVLWELVRSVEDAPPDRAPDARVRVERLLPVLREQCAEAWTLERMASSCGMGRTHFTRMLKELTGDTPVQYLNRLRIERAEALLGASDRSVLDVALACGFQSSQYFATVYRTFTGRAPRRARR